MLERLPRVSLAEILIEVDVWIHYSDQLTHATAATTRSADLDMHRYAALAGLATKVGLGPMAGAAHLSYE